MIVVDPRADHTARTEEVAGRISSDGASRWPRVESTISNSDSLRSAISVRRVSPDVSARNRFGFRFSCGCDWIFVGICPATIYAFWLYGCARQLGVQCRGLWSQSVGDRSASGTKRGLQKPMSASLKSVSRSVHGRPNFRRPLYLR